MQFKLPRGSRWALLLLALGVGLGFVPDYRSKAFVQKQNEKQAIKEAGKQLVELTKHTLTNRPPALESTEKSLEAVNELGDQMTKKINTRDQAIKDIAKMSDRLKDEIKDFAKDPALRRMDEAARSQGDNSSDMNALQKQIQDAEKQLGENSATPDQMDKLNKELSQLQEAAKAEAGQEWRPEPVREGQPLAIAGGVVQTGAEPGDEHAEPGPGDPGAGGQPGEPGPPGHAHIPGRPGEDAGPGQEPAADAAVASREDGEGSGGAVEVRTAGSRAAHVAEDD